jgi:hypothetical protein
VVLTPTALSVDELDNDRRSLGLLQQQARGDAPPGTRHVPSSLRRASLERKNGAVVKSVSQTVLIRAVTAEGTLTALVEVVGAGKKW